MLTLSQDECTKIKDYVTALIDGSSNLRPATPCEVHGKTVPELHEMLAVRALPKTGKKAVLLDRLQTVTPDYENVRRAYQREVRYTLAYLIDRYCDDGMGDKPQDMCRIEYWLAHIEPQSIIPKCR